MSIRVTQCVGVLGRETGQCAASRRTLDAALFCCKPYFSYGTGWLRCAVPGCKVLCSPDAFYQDRFKDKGLQRGSGGQIVIAVEGHTGADSVLCDFQP